MRYISIKVILCLFCLILQMSVSGCSGSVADWESLYRTKSDELQTEDVQDTADSIDETESTVYVHICGAVVNPGVYALPKGARVNQAIEMAGGLTEEADFLLLNQARIVGDGEQIRVYTKEEASNMKSDAEVQAGGSIHEENKVNINTADTALLMTLPGIGETRADAIIEYRTLHGAFQTIEEIKNIPGIKDAVFLKIKDKIIV